MVLPVKTSEKAKTKKTKAKKKTKKEKQKKEPSKNHQDMKFSHGVFFFGFLVSFLFGPPQPDIPNYWHLPLLPLVLRQHLCINHYITFCIQVSKLI